MAVNIFQQENSNTKQVVEAGEVPTSVEMNQLVTCEECSSAIFEYIKTESEYGEYVCSQCDSEKTVVVG